MSENQQAYFLKQWKDQMRQGIQLVYPNISEKKLNALLDDQISKKLDNKPCYVVNNYTERIMKTNVLEVFELIHKHNLIMSGAGTLFVQHNAMLNPFVDYVETNMSERDKLKKLMKTFEPESPEYARKDGQQGNRKTKINSLYGGLGYFRFIFHNIFLAEATTSMGQNIICTSLCAFENFLEDNIGFLNENETMVYLQNIIEEYHMKYQDGDYSFLEKIDDERLLKRIMKKCTYSYSQTFLDQIKKVILNLDENCKKLLYYKNNFEEFNQNPIIKGKIKYILQNIGIFMKPDLRDIEAKDVVDQINIVWDLYETFVMYNHQTADRIRKGYYTDRKAVLYVDTDSNMLCIAKWVHYCIKDVLRDEFMEMDLTNLQFAAVNVMALFMQRCVTLALHDMARNMNITEEYIDKLIMKNEFLFLRALFVSAKKRYLALIMLREGQLMKGGKGKLEVKGFDFIKATTKKNIRERYEDISMYDILKSDEVDKKQILSRIYGLRDDIRKSLERGETIYYKQANLNPIENYKFPYRIPGIKGTILWNALFPNNEIDLPVDVDIVPIKIFKSKKETEKFKTKYPEIFQIIEDQILNSPIEAVRKMDINVIAKPKQDDLVLPEWYFDMVDKETIEHNALNLFIPILDSLGMVVQASSSSNNKTHITNIVKI